MLLGKTTGKVTRETIKIIKNVSCTLLAISLSIFISGKTRYLKQQTRPALAEPCFNNRRTHASVYKLTCNSQSNACRGSLSATLKLNARVIPTAASVLASTPTGTSATKHNPNLQHRRMHGLKIQ